MTLRLAATLVLALLLASVRADAHHSYAAEFDRDSPQTIEGEVHLGGSCFPGRKGVPLFEHRLNVRSQTFVGRGSQGSNGKQGFQFVFAFPRQDIRIIQDGVYPLKMTISGILRRNHTADDRAVFVDLKTAWVIEGLGHGHEDLKNSSDRSVILERTPDTITANAKLFQFTEITEENIGKIFRIQK